MKRMLFLVCLFAGILNAQDKPENLKTAGLLIGGGSLVGFDYEFRTSNVLGFHLGAGLAGAGAGFRFHFGAQKFSPFLDLNFKDTGFGKGLDLIALDYGGTWKLKENSGLHYYVGLAKVMRIDSKFEDDVFGGKGIPSVILTYGLGWAW